MPVRSSATIRLARGTPDRNRRSTDGQWPATFGPVTRTARGCKLAPSSRCTSPPGASSTSPGASRVPSSARRTSGAIRVFSRVTKLFRKFSGMCWVISVAGQLAANPDSSVSIASTPPVEAPTISTLSKLPPDFCAGGVGAAVLRTVARAAITSVSTRLRSEVVSRLASGFSRQATAPSDRASSPSSLPRGIQDENITTGVGRYFISSARNSSPLLPGISASSVRTSGAYWRTCDRA